MASDNSSAMASARQLEHSPFSIHEAVVAQLNRGGLTPELHEGSSWVTAKLAAGEADLHLAVDVSEERGMAWVFGIVRGRVPADRRRAIAELLARVNYDISGITFDLAFSDGEIRIRAFLDALEPAATGARLHRLITVMAARAEQWYPAIMAVAFGDVDPADAYEREVVAAAATAAAKPEVQ